MATAARPDWPTRPSSWAACSTTSTAKSPATSVKNSAASNSSTPATGASADQVILDDVERWSYTANDVIGKDHYFSGIHNGVNVGWQILPGQVFTSPSFMKNPLGSPLCLRQVVGRPVHGAGEPVGPAHAVRVGRPAGGRRAELPDGSRHASAGSPRALRSGRRRSTSGPSPSP